MEGRAGGEPYHRRAEYFNAGLIKSVVVYSDNWDEPLMRIDDDPRGRSCRVTLPGGRVFEIAAQGGDETTYQTLEEVEA